jgi:hypothetical protein
LARDWARELGLSAASAWLKDYAWLEFSSTGRSGARALFAQSRASSEQPPAVGLLSAACSVSLHPEAESGNLERALSRYGRLRDLDPILPAFARHLARRSTAEDRALLEHRIAHAEVDDSPLGWGLRFIVRGDVQLDDGTIVTLDELCDRHGLARLPLLEEMPPELEVDWDAEG